MSEIVVPFCDTHVHGRNGPMKRAVAEDVGKRTGAGILMPNTDPRLLTGADARDYLDGWEPLVGGRWLATLYLTPSTDPDDVVEAYRRRLISGVKFYPPGHQQAHNSVSVEDLVSRSGKTYAVLSRMADENIPLHLHGEVVADEKGEVDPYGREARFIEQVLPVLRELHPGLRISLEHISSKQAARYMRKHGNAELLVCTITAHHLILDRRDMFQGGLRPDLWCLPVLKSEAHKLALQNLVAAGHPFVLAGTDLAPHDAATRKHADCCFGGVYTGHCSVEAYAEVFDDLHVLEHLEEFLWGNAIRFHENLREATPRPVRLIREDWQVERPTRWAPGKFITPFGYFKNPSDRRTFRWKLAS